MTQNETQNLKNFCLKSTKNDFDSVASSVSFFSAFKKAKKAMF